MPFPANPYRGDTFTAEGLTSVWTGEHWMPLSVPRWRARAALAEAGLLAQVDAAMAALGGPVFEWWQHGAEMERAHPRIAEIAGALGLTSAQVDALFRRAAVIEP